jgi:hypothetical protein
MLKRKILKDSNKTMKILDDIDLKNIISFLIEIIK